MSKYLFFMSKYSFFMSKYSFSPPRSGGLVNCGYAFMGTGTNMISRTDLKNTLYPIPISDIILKPPFLELIFHSAHDGEGPSSKLFLDKDFDFCPPKFRVPRARASQPKSILDSQHFFLLAKSILDSQHFFCSKSPF